MSDEYFTQRNLTGVEGVKTLELQFPYALLPFFHVSCL